MIGLVVVATGLSVSPEGSGGISVGVDNEDDECHTAEGYLTQAF